MTALLWLGTVLFFCFICNVLTMRIEKLEDWRRFMASKHDDTEPRP